MPKTDQIEVISPDGAITFYDLDASKGITNIGRHPDNDIVLDAPNVAPFHAILDHRHKPYEIVILSEQGETRLAGQALAANISTALQNWDTVEIDSHLIILLEEAGTQVVPRTPSKPTPATTGTRVVPTPTPQSGAIVPTSPASAATAAHQPWRLNAPQPDHSDEFIVAQIAQREVTLNVDQPTLFEVTLINGGPIVATFGVDVEGLDPQWVTLSPPQINLNEGERGVVFVQITVPRHPSSLAGLYNVAIVVTSPNHAGRSSRLGMMATVTPYYAFKVGELSPRQQNVSWRRQTARTTIPLTNQSNTATVFRLTAEDDEKACHFEFEIPAERTRLAVQAQIPLQPDEAVAVPLYVTPTKRPVFGMRRRLHSYTATVTMQEAEPTPRSLLGQLRSRPLLGPLSLFLILLCLAILAVLIFRPNAQWLLANGAPEMTITSGDEVLISWKASALSHNVTVDTVDTRNPPIDTNQERRGQTRLSPLYSGVYTLRAESFLFPLLDPLFPQTFDPLIVSTKDVRINVKPIYPLIQSFSLEGYREQLDTTSYRIFQGDAVNLRWTVLNANEVELATNGEPQLLPTTEHIAQRDISPQINTAYKLVARNLYTGEGAPAAEAGLSIFVITPSPTPVPVPVPQRFTARPLEITAGETVTVEWEVPNATKVNITNLPGDFPPLGSTTHKPLETTDYRLTAFYKEGDIEKSMVSSIVVRVIVKPAPTPTPQPQPAVINLFEGTYSGNFYHGLSKQVTLVWSVTGDTTNIEIEGATMGIVSNLSPSGQMQIIISDDTFFILKAYYKDEVKASKMIQLTAKDPPPTPTPIPPAPVITKFEASAADLAAVIVGIPVASGTTNTRAYEVKYGSNILLSWSVENAKKVTLDFTDKGGAKTSYGDQSLAGQLPVNVTASGQYQLKAEHQDPSQSPVYAYIQINLMAMTKPPAPTNVRGPVATSQTPPIEITWEYVAASQDDIIGFIVYRGNSGDSPDAFIQQSGLISQTTPPYAWTDSATSVCGKGYYVVALYVDIADNQTKESDKSNIWYSEPCPTPAP
ncbi:MAG TPA: FHA domain-containing protein [Anaerolineae bacterium]|nr:FHA domain-containing protein [Anaerolineae bacterium]HQH37988.1 FHA domain-containing protein [Anaerolineae bacterium]